MGPGGGFRGGGRSVHHGGGGFGRSEGGRGGRGGRVGRGQVRDLLLAALVDGPAHGYELMSRLEERTGGRWRPSPGSVYPAMQMFEDQGLVSSREVEGRRVFELTDAGRAQADQSRLRDLADTGPAGTARLALRDELAQLHGAVRQAGVSVKAEQLEQVTRIIRDARQAVYRLLAEQ